MNVSIEIPLEQYDRFVDQCEPTSRAYTLLKNGLIFRRPKGDHFERIVEIRCSVEEANLLRDSAKELYPVAVPEIERAIVDVNKPARETQRLTTPLPLKQKQLVPLRNHPQMKYRGQPNWPPIWVSKGKGSIKRLTGDVGVLTDVLWYPNVPTRLFLTIELDQERYMGTLLFTDRTFCFQLYGILRQYIGWSIIDIGDLDLSRTL